MWPTRPDLHHPPFQHHHQHQLQLRQEDTRYGYPQQPAQGSYAPHGDAATGRGAAHALPSGVGRGYPSAPAPAPATAQIGAGGGGGGHAHWQHTPHAGAPILYAPNGDKIVFDGGDGTWICEMPDGTPYQVSAFAYPLQDLDEPAQPHEHQQQHVEQQPQPQPQPLPPQQQQQPPPRNPPYRYHDDGVYEDTDDDEESVEESHAHTQPPQLEPPAAEVHHTGESVYDFTRPSTSSLANFAGPPEPAHQTSSPTYALTAASSPAYSSSSYTPVSSPTYPPCPSATYGAGSSPYDGAGSSPYAPAPSSSSSQYTPAPSSLFDRTASSAYIPAASSANYTPTFNTASSSTSYTPAAAASSKYAGTGSPFAAGPSSSAAYDHPHLGYREDDSDDDRSPTPPSPALDPYHALTFEGPPTWVPGAYEREPRVKYEHDYIKREELDTRPSSSGKALARPSSYRHAPYTPTEYGIEPLYGADPFAMRPPDGYEPAADRFPMPTADTYGWTPAADTPERPAFYPLRRPPPPTPAPYTLPSAPALPTADRHLGPQRQRYGHEEELALPIIVPNKPKRAPACDLCRARKAACKPTRVDGVCAKCADKNKTCIFTPRPPGVAKRGRPRKTENRYPPGHPLAAKPKPQEPEPENQEEGGAGEAEGVLPGLRRRSREAEDVKEEDAEARVKTEEPGADA